MLATCTRFAIFAFCADFPLKWQVGRSLSAAELRFMAGG